MTIYKTPKTIMVDLSQDDPGRLLARARELAAKEGITIRGSDRQGTVSGKNIDGDYLVMDSSIRITLRETPNVPWFLVKLMISGFVYGKG